MIRISRLAKIVVNELTENGFKAYPVGGCIRDSLLGKIPHDWDITTNARPDEILEVFKNYKTLDIGRKFGTISVEVDDHFVEVTTMRKESDYADGRHPSSVIFFDDIYEDLNRRDLTINAMAYDIYSKTLIDPFRGQLDLKKKIIRTVGEPEVRFSEDALRILRAIRFSAQLDFRIDYKTLYNIAKYSYLLKNVATERIKVELDKILMADNYPALRNLYNTGIFKVLFPPIDKMFKTTQNSTYHVYNVGDHALMSVLNISGDIDLKYTMLLHDIGKIVTKTTVNGHDHFYDHAQYSVAIANKILKKLKFPTKSINRILKLIECHDTILSTRFRSMNKFIVDKEFSYEDMEDLIKVQLADNLAQNPMRLGSFYIFDEILEKYKEVFNGPHKIKDLAVNGNHMKMLGYEGESIKKVLSYLLKQVIANNELNNEEKLMIIASKSYKQFQKQENIQERKKQESNPV
ncbi:CCA tRNA nucleotidyltransferase [Miniphocaeibacter halophilus]|uniref:HD domain-containing protein n=1 Tax=Miniphocaeibacter halophilus TaxID=2931922 RepID=A0AC61MYN0_9FIRM|nr:HD domain-containing protein [Miniphocaeibacter halophilus]QQK08730.1 HD domain-containing protein [Miniphocaeibacter halophilus]